MKLLVNDGWVGVLYENGAFARLLSAGRYVLPTWPWSPVHKVVMLDLRERSTTIKNQEILTADKVSVRVSLLIYFKVTDPKAALTQVTDFESRIYEDVQLAARRFLATQALDQILRDRNELSDAIRTDVTASAKTYGVEIMRADVKDLAFPGNLREIMNRVIETERGVGGEADRRSFARRGRPARGPRPARLRILVFGAHPDDAESHCGGLMALYRELGHAVKVISVTNGDAGHHQISGPALAQRRRAELESALGAIGATCEVWEHHDGRLRPTLELRWQIISEIRRFRPDLVLTHRANNYPIPITAPSASPSRTPPTWSPSLRSFQPFPRCVATRSSPA